MWIIFYHNRPHNVLLCGTAYRVGKHEDCDVQLCDSEDKSISRLHLTISIGCAEEEEEVEGRGSGWRCAPPRLSVPDVTLVDTSTYGTTVTPVRVCWESGVEEEEDLQRLVEQPTTAGREGRERMTSALHNNDNTTNTTTTTTTIIIGDEDDADAHGDTAIGNRKKSYNGSSTLTSNCGCGDVSVEGTPFVRLPSWDILPGLGQYSVPPWVAPHQHQQQVRDFMPVRGHTPPSSTTLLHRSSDQPPPPSSAIHQTNRNDNSGVTSTGERIKLVKGIPSRLPTVPSSSSSARARRRNEEGEEAGGYTAFHIYLGHNATSFVLVWTELNTVVEEIDGDHMLKLSRSLQRMGIRLLTPKLLLLKEEEEDARCSPSYTAQERLSSPLDAVHFYITDYFPSSVVALRLLACRGFQSLRTRCSHPRPSACHAAALRRPHPRPRPPVTVLNSAYIILAAGLLSTRCDHRARAVRCDRERIIIGQDKRRDLTTPWAMPLLTEEEVEACETSERIHATTGLPSVARFPPPFVHSFWEMVLKIPTATSPNNASVCQEEKPAMQIHEQGASNMHQHSGALVENAIIGSTAQPPAFLRSKLVLEMLDSRRCPSLNASQEGCHDDTALAPRRCLFEGYTFIVLQRRLWCEVRHYVLAAGGQLLYHDILERKDEGGKEGDMRPAFSRQEEAARCCMDFLVEMERYGAATARSFSPPIFEASGDGERSTPSSRKRKREDLVHPKYTHDGDAANISQSAAVSQTHSGRRKLVLLFNQDDDDDDDEEEEEEENAMRTVGDHMKCRNHTDTEGLWLGQRDEQRTTATTTRDRRSGEEGKALSYPPSSSFCSSSAQKHTQTPRLAPPTPLPCPHDLPDNDDSRKDDTATATASYRHHPTAAEFCAVLQDLLLCPVTFSQYHRQFAHRAWDRRITNQTTAGQRTENKKNPCASHPLPQGGGHSSAVVMYQLVCSLFYVSQQDGIGGVAEYAALVESLVRGVPLSRVLVQHHQPMTCEGSAHSSSLHRARSGAAEEVHAAGDDPNASSSSSSSMGTSPSQSARLSSAVPLLSLCGDQQTAKSLGRRRSVDGGDGWVIPAQKKKARERDTEEDCLAGSRRGGGSVPNYLMTASAAAVALSAYPCFSGWSLTARDANGDPRTGGPPPHRTPREGGEDEGEGGPLLVRKTFKKQCVRTPSSASATASSRAVGQTVTTTTTQAPGGAGGRAGGVPSGTSRQERGKALLHEWNAGGVEGVRATGRPPASSGCLAGGVMDELDRLLHTPPAPAESCHSADRQADNNSAMIFSLNRGEGGEEAGRRNPFDCALVERTAAVRWRGEDGTSMGRGRTVGARRRGGGAGRGGRASTFSGLVDGPLSAADLFGHDLLQPPSPPPPLAQPPLHTECDTPQRAEATLESRRTPRQRGAANHRNGRISSSNPHHNHQQQQQEGFFVKRKILMTARSSSAYKDDYAFLRSLNDDGPPTLSAFAVQPRSERVTGAAGGRPTTTNVKASSRREERRMENDGRGSSVFDLQNIF